MLLENLQTQTRNGDVLYNDNLADGLSKPKAWERLRIFSRKYSHAWILSYVLLYLIWFVWLEKNTQPRYWIHSPLDDLIPFVPVFIIPYILWFFYVAVMVVYLLFTSRHDYYHLCAYLFIGMTLCLVIYTIWPNGHHLRPNLTGQDIFTRIVGHLYTLDTATNVAPSIHVYNSIGIHLAVMHNEKLRNKKGLQATSFIVALLIILSTVFLKQHSVDDVLYALPLALAMYFVVYRIDWTAIGVNGKRVSPESPEILND